MTDLRVIHVDGPDVRLCGLVAYDDRLYFMVDDPRRMPVALDGRVESLPEPELRSILLAEETRVIVAGRTFMSKVVTKKIKNDDANLDYTFDWSAWLESDTISDSVWEIIPSGEVTQTNSTHSTTTATVWLSGGVVGNVYLIKNTITTVGGRIDERIFQLKIESGGE